MVLFILWTRSGASTSLDIRCGVEHPRHWLSDGRGDASFFKCCVWSSTALQCFVPTDPVGLSASSSVVGASAAVVFDTIGRGSTDGVRSCAAIHCVPEQNNARSTWES